MPTSSFTSTTGASFWLHVTIAPATLRLINRCTCSQAPGYALQPGAPPRPQPDDQ